MNYRKIDVGRVDIMRVRVNFLVYTHQWVLFGGKFAQYHFDIKTLTFEEVKFVKITIIIILLLVYSIRLEQTIKIKISGAPSVRAVFSSLFIFLNITH